MRRYLISENVDNSGWPLIKLNVFFLYQVILEIECAHENSTHIFKKLHIPLWSQVT